MYLLLAVVLLTASSGRPGAGPAPAWLDPATATAAPLPEARGASPQQVASSVTSAQASGSAPRSPSSAEILRLRSQIDRLLQGPAWPGARWSVLITSLDHGDTLYAHSAAEPLVPASNMKLFTSAAALFYLGPSFRFTTYLLADGRIEGGVLHGDVILYGTGDPTLSDRFHEDKLAVFEAFADSLEALGVREVRGSVVGDASYWGPTQAGYGWRENYMNAWYAASSSALSYNENVVTLHVRPASDADWRPRVQLVPGGEGIAIVNQALTVSRGTSKIDVDRVAYDGPILVTGQIARGQTGVWRQVPVADPPRYGAAVFREVLKARGIEIAGDARAVDRPASSRAGGRQVFAPMFDGSEPVQVLAVERSPQLIVILEVVNQLSHNMYAEQMLRAIGRATRGEGTIEAGARGVQQFIQDEVGRSSVSIFDGSGLSVLNRASAEDLIALLSYMAASPMSQAFTRTLPQAGDRRLRRMVGTPAERNLRAKTGTIERVSSLSGYVTAANGERLAFAIVGNNLP
jgi:serine-type D-Ala-D-Ala carboxypeptidase/endopeptidase (penicillin-binding protein 4)